MNSASFGKLFPLGSHLCREPMPPMAELKKDMEILKRHGFNLVKLQEHWQVDEPREGHYDFSRYEELIEHAATLDLGVYLGLTCEQAPHWLYCKHPDCRMVGRNGLPIAYEAITALPGDGKPGPCYDHPGAMDDMLRFIRRLVAVIGRYENVVLWNTWQEIGYWAEGIVGQHVCYCAHTLEHYRSWLRERYGNLDALNRGWNTRYADWADVAPERGNSRRPEAHEICWRYFMDNVQIGAVLKARAAAIREADPLKRPVFAHKGSQVIGAGQDWTYARCQDFLGCSCYPAWGSLHGWDDGGERPFARHRALLSEMADSVALRYDYIRSANRPGQPVWAAEFQGGPVSTGFHKGRVPSPDDIRRWMLTAVSSGVTAISFWVARAEIMAAEVNGFSLLDSEGEGTPRLGEAARIGRALNAHADLFARPTLAPAEVAILVNEWNHQLCSCLVQGGEHLGYATRGWYRLLWEAGIPADFLEVSQLDEMGKKYNALILPFPLSLSEEAATKIERYVLQGGNLIGEACPGRINEHGFSNRGELSPVMRRLCGVRHKSFAMVSEPDGGKRWSPAERTWGEYLEPAMLTGARRLEGHKLRANVYVETFECEGSEPCLMHGPAIAGTVSRVGQGCAWLLGTFVGHNGTAYRDDETRACIRAILEQCGVRPEHQGSLLLRKRVLPEKEAWVFTNPTEQDVTEQIPMKGWRKVEDLLGGSLEWRDEAVALKVPSLDIRVLIVSGKGRA